MKYQIPAGVLTGDQVQEVFALAKEKDLPFPLSMLLEVIASTPY
jgi:hypothetical protein